MKKNLPLALGLVLCAPIGLAADETRDTQDSVITFFDHGPKPAVVVATFRGETVQVLVLDANDRASQWRTEFQQSLLLSQNWPLTHDLSLDRLRLSLLSIAGSLAYSHWEMAGGPRTSEPPGSGSAAPELQSCVTVGGCGICDLGGDSCIYWACSDGSYCTGCGTNEWNCGSW